MWRARRTPRRDLVLVTIHQPEHLPWLGFVHKVAQAELFVALDNVAYRKRYVQNRNRIFGRDGAQWLTVPVLTHNAGDRRIDAIRVSPATNWRRKYIATLTQTYGRHPYAGRYLPDVVTAIERAGERIVDLNMTIIERMLDWFGVRTRIVRGSSLQVGGAKTDLLVAICRAVGATTYLSGPSGRDYLVPEKFRDAGIELAFEHFVHPVYAQLGGRPFVSHLSALDALLNLGPQAASLLGQVTAQEQGTKAHSSAL